jgi:hypothetical protein
MEELSIESLIEDFKILANGDPKIKFILASHLKFICEEIAKINVELKDLKEKNK